MPDKIILNIAGGQGEVFVEMDGARHKLRKCKSITIRADAEGNNEADLTLYAIDLSRDRTGGLISEVEITRNNADAILRTDAFRALSFIGDVEAHELHRLSAALGGELASSGGSVRWGEERKGIDALRKIIAELERRKEIPF